MNAMEILGLTIQLEQWEKHRKVPLYITNTFLIQKATINGISCLSLSPRGELPTISALRNQIKKIQNVDLLPVFLNLETITNFRRDSLVSHEIPFVWADKMVYLPFMMTYLTNIRNQTNVMSEKLTMSAQLLFIWILYQDTERFYISDAVDNLCFSNMTITRAYRQLVDTKLFSEHKSGRKIYLMTPYSKTELIKKMKPFMKSPVIHTGYVEKSDFNMDMVESGESALSYYSFLNPPQISTFAIHKSYAKKLHMNQELVDTSKQIKIKIWDYDPHLFLEDSQIIDVISLITSFLEIEDERIEKEIDFLIENFK